MKILDLYCGAGGAAMGLKEACDKEGIGCEITGVDIREQPQYPFNFIKKDVRNLPLSFLESADFIWASPPCQAYSRGTLQLRNRGKVYPDLVLFTQEILEEVCFIPSVIENVPNAPIRKDLLLCGEMFGMRIIRHRHFELRGFKARQIRHRKHRNRIWDGSAVGVYTANRLGCWCKKWNRRYFMVENNLNIRQQTMGNNLHKKYYVTVAGHGGDSGKGNTTLKAWQEAMRIDWITDKKMLAEAVPPAYSEYILLEFLRR